MTLEEIARQMADTVKAAVSKGLAEQQKVFDARIKELQAQIAEKEISVPTAEQVAASLEGEFAKWALGFERKADGVLDKAVEKLRQPADGKDALALEDFDISLSDDGRTVTMQLKSGEQLVERTLKIPSVLYKGVFTEQAYEKGDAVTYGGSLWIAEKDCPDGRPGASDDWRLAVKRGRDYREPVKTGKGA